MKCAIYARVSTADQTCENQLAELRQYASARGWTATEYVDAGWSGAKASRPQLDRLMADARLRKFDCVLVSKLDRFGRSVAHLTSAVQELDHLGVRFLVPVQGLDSDKSNATGRLLFNVLASIAEFERELIRERVRAGMNRARADGTQLGRRHKIFDRGKVRELRAAGLPLRAIAKQVRCSLGSVQNVLAGRFEPS